MASKHRCTNPNLFGSILGSLRRREVKSPISEIREENIRLGRAQMAVLRKLSSGGRRLLLVDDADRWSFIGAAKSWPSSHKAALHSLVDKGLVRLRAEDSDARGVYMRVERA